MNTEIKRYKKVGKELERIDFLLYDAKGTNFLERAIEAEKQRREVTFAKAEGRKIKIDKDAGLTMSVSKSWVIKHYENEIYSFKVTSSTPFCVMDFVNFISNVRKNLEDILS